MLLSTPLIVLGQTSFALQYGRSQLNDGEKRAENLEPSGNTYKLILSERFSKAEVSAMFRYAALSDDFKFEGTEGEFKQTQGSFGLHVGYWIFPWLQPHIGFARHGISEKIKGKFSASQESDIEDKYAVEGKTAQGLYSGVDFSLFSSKSMQLFLNYNYYHFNNIAAHDWEICAGLRIYFGSSGKKRDAKDDGVFTKMFKDMLEFMTK